jgi:hypothetical protein
VSIASRQRTIAHLDMDHFGGLLSTQADRKLQTRP